MKRLLFSLCFLFTLFSVTMAADIISGNVYRISTLCSGNRTLMVSGSSFDLNTKITLWKETGTNSQRWRITAASDGSFFIDNMYTAKRLTQQSIVSVIQSSLSSTSTYRWLLVPIDEPGYENCFYIYNKSNTQNVLEVTTGTETIDGGSLNLATKASTKESRQIWKVEQTTELENKLTPAIRTTMMQGWKNRNHNKLKTSTGFWGEAECMEIILDAYETTGKEEYKIMFEEVYRNFVSGTGGWETTNGKNWMWNEFNDDIVWATLASIRAYAMFGNSTAYNLDYLNIAKSNFDNMYSRALLKVDDLYNLLRWKQSATSTNSCVNGPAIVACCYLAEATGQDVYYQRAKQLYANLRIHQYSATTGRVYDNFGSNWASTYNQGSYLGAAVMLYNHFGDEMYKNDAELIMKFTRNNLCNSAGIINVCGDEVGDLPIFKGILMRYVRRFVVDMGKTEYVDWMQKNALQAYNNINSEGIAWTAWWKKTEERDYAYTGTFTAVSAAFNAPLNGNTIASKDAFSVIQAGSFNYVSKVNSENHLDGGEMDIIGIQLGAYLGYNFVDFKNTLATGVELQVANDNVARSVEIRLGSAKGTLMGTIAIPASDGNFNTVQGKLTKPIDGNKNIYLVFKGSKNGLKFKSFKFTSSADGNIYPDITTSNYGTITSSHTVTTLNNLINDKLSDEMIISSNTNDQVWVQYESNYPALLSGYSVASGNGTTANNPKSWKLQASNNATDWVDIDQQNDQVFDEPCQLKKYNIAATDNYKYFRLTILELNGTTTELRLAEWQLYGSTLALNDITSDGGILTSQFAGNNNDENFSKIIDKAIQTKYNIDNQSNMWFQYKSQGQYKLNSYSISSANNDEASDPKSWILYGSTNGSTWEIIDEQMDQKFAYRNSTQIYNCNTSKSYTYFKLQITSNNGALSTQFAEWQLFGNYEFEFYYHDFTKSGGVLASSSAIQNDTTLKSLTDNNAGTYYALNAATLPVWVQYSSPIPVTIMGYSITSGADKNYDPKSWKLQGSTDGITWKDIETRTNIVFETRYMHKKFATSSSPSYNQYRLQITAANSNEVRIADWQIYGLYINRYEATSNAGGILTTQWPGKNDENGTTKLIDKSKDTKYYNEGRKAYWTIYESARPFKINAYSLTSANDYPERDPKSWTLYGSNNKTTWTAIDHQENQLFIYRFSTLYYPVSTNTKYKYYKLNIEDNMGEKGIQLSECQFFGEFNEYETDITSNGGVLTASQAAINQTTINDLIDNNETTKFYSGVTSTQLASGVWFKYESPLPISLKTYSITSSNDNPNNDPRNWILQGSNDDENWTDLNTQTNVMFDSRCERKLFDVPSNTGYKFFRLYITAAKTTAVGLQLAEWELFGDPVSGLKNLNSVNSLHFYPNPATDFIIVNATEECKISILNINGVSQFSTEMTPGEHKLNIDNLQQGIYIVRMENNNIVKTNVFVKK